jgi:hypothetical protein
VQLQRLRRAPGCRVTEKSQLIVGLAGTGDQTRAARDIRDIHYDYFFICTSDCKHNFFSRKSQEEANWEEYRLEEEYREEMKRKDSARSKAPVVWDDADERKCQERYRKKYSSH